MGILRIHGKNKQTPANPLSALSPEDEKCIKACLNGSPEAFGEIVERYEKQIFNLMIRSTLNYETAEDLTQDAFLRAFQKLKKFDMRKKFLPWLYQISINVARDHFRRRKIEFGLFRKIFQGNEEFGLTADLPNTAIDAFEDQAEMMRILGQMPIIHREALLLHYRDGYTMKEVSDFLGISESGVKMRIKRGLAKIRGQMEGLANGHE
ncbi:RNA polymerase sigma factor [Desulfobacterales bacterium HSG17]|nr:RNA polymerase sigma factor [Desulfobacterales bacterium HSG17]